MLNSRYGGRYRVQDRLVRRVMPHHLARLKQDVSGFLNRHDEEQILTRHSRCVYAKPLRVMFKKYI
jgi:hypothetical protein